MDATVQAQIVNQRRFAQATVREFAAAVRAGDHERCAGTFEALGRVAYGWRRAMRAVANAPAPDDFRLRFLKLWVENGDDLRSEVSDDLVLIKALWSLLPRYIGPAPLTLYRGDTLWNRRRRTYGLAWTTELEIAHAYARGLCRSSQGGSVLLKTTASAQAIISAPAQGEDRYGEQEYLLDRRRLERVEVIERFTQVAPG
jgi:hypothetical protein